MKTREAFYKRTLPDFIPDRRSSLLVCGGGHLDKRVLSDLGFTNVTISNLDERIQDDEYIPFTWRHENAESLSCEDEQFDFVIVHAALHHSSRPHTALTEMYRVARKGILVFESRDSTLMKCLERLRVVQTYEHSAVYYNDCQYGGVNNTDIPNYIYRWTEREVEKTVRSYAPHAEHTFHYRYGTAFPCTPELEHKGKIKYICLKIAQPIFMAFAAFFPKQQNLFAFCVEKPDLPDRLHPWLTMRNGHISYSREWGHKRYERKV